MKIIEYSHENSDSDDDYQNDKNDIRNVTFKDNIAHIPNGEIHVKVSLHHMKEIKFDCYRFIRDLDVGRIIYVDDGNYIFRKEIFKPEVYKQLVEEKNNSEEFIQFIKDKYQGQDNGITDYKKICDEQRLNYPNERTFEMYRSRFLRPFCDNMREFLFKKYRDQFYVKENIRYRKAYMLGFVCDKCRDFDCEYEYSRPERKIVLKTLLTSREYFDIEDEDKYHYLDLDNHRFHIQGETVDLCESCFTNLPWNLPEAEKRLTLAKVLRHYNVPDDLCDLCYKEP